jgi:hypothetical protein
MYARLLTTTRRTCRIPERSVASRCVTGAPAAGRKSLPLNPAVDGVAGYAQVGSDAINAHPLLFHHRQRILGIQ